jgi:peptidoglycan/LPS O-acetylase OafA/YrhL
MSAIEAVFLVVVWFLLLRARELRTWPMLVLLLVLTSVFVNAPQFGDVASLAVRIGVMAVALPVGLLTLWRTARASNREAPPE